MKINLISLVPVFIGLAVIAMVVSVLAFAFMPDERPPRMAKVCTDYETSITMQPVIGANGTVTMTPITTSHCVQRERQCVVGEDYKGPLTCKDVE